MTIIDSKDLDARMGRTVDPKSVPTHNGGDHGVMEGRFLAQSETVVEQSGHGQRGATIVDGTAVPDANYYGSGTIISVSDAPPLVPEHEPKVAPAPATEQPAAQAKPTSVAALLASLRLGKKS